MFEGDVVIAYNYSLGKNRQWKKTKAKESALVDPVNRLLASHVRLSSPPPSTKRSTLV